MRSMVLKHQNDEWQKLVELWQREVGHSRAVRLNLDGRLCLRESLIQRTPEYPFTFRVAPN